MIIGLIGPNAAGKGEIANYLVTKGFKYYSLSDEIREELRKKKKEINRENLINEGNYLRKTYGANILAKRVLDKIKKEKWKNFVVDSVRNPEEVLALKEEKEFYYLGVDAPVELRYERAIERRREGEKYSLKKFIDLEKSENGKNKNSQQLDNCMKMIDFKIINDSTLDKLHKKIDKMLGEGKHEKGN
jgi:dephospho-CoA kinase